MGRVLSVVDPRHSQRTIHRQLRSMWPEYLCVHAKGAMVRRLIFLFPIGMMTLFKITRSLKYCHLNVSGYLQCECGLRRDRTSPTDHPTMNWAWWDITRRWCGRLRIKWGVDWPGAWRVDRGTNPFTITSAITVQCKCKVILKILVHAPGDRTY